MKHSRWIGEQLSILGEAFGEPLTRERLKIYAADLEDIEPRQLAIAFRRARQELRFFPRIVEIRNFAAAAADPFAEYRQVASEQGRIVSAPKQLVAETSEIRARLDAEGLPSGLAQLHGLLKKFREITAQKAGNTNET
jgi:hypothetical protein